MWQIHTNTAALLPFIAPNRGMAMILAWGACDRVAARSSLLAGALAGVTVSCRAANAHVGVRSLNATKTLIRPHLRKATRR